MAHADVAAHYFRLARDPRREIPVLRREAGHLAGWLPPHRESTP